MDILQDVSEGKKGLKFTTKIVKIFMEIHTFQRRHYEIKLQLELQEEI